MLPVVCPVCGKTPIRDYGTYDGSGESMYFILCVHPDHSPIPIHADGYTPAEAVQAWNKMIADGTWPRE